MKQALLFLVIIITLMGCSKNPTEQNNNLGDVISISFADSNGIAFGGWANAADTCFGIQIRIICDEQYYTDIVSGSDSMGAVIFKSNGKKLYFDWVASYYSTIISETRRNSYFEAHKIVYASTDTGIGYNPNTDEPYLTLNDTLSHPDSIRVYIHWFSLSTPKVRYSKQQTFINPPYTETFVIY